MGSSSKYQSLPQMPMYSTSPPNTHSKSPPKPSASSPMTQPLSTSTNGANGVRSDILRKHSKKSSAPENILRSPSKKQAATSDGTPRRNRSHKMRSEIQAWTDEKEKIILGPYDYLFGHPGKDIRSALIDAFDAFLKVPPPSLSIIRKIVGMLHTSSLLIDDVQDSSQLRRGVPVAHNIFGTAQTINSANYVYFLALAELNLLEHKDAAIEIFTTELLNLHRGQGMDLYWRDTLTCPSEDDYLEMVQNKTGGLFRLAVKLMQAESTVSPPERPDCVPLVNLMGLVFQICDDYLNLRSDKYEKNKGLCEDLTEGKFSFPVIHSIRSDSGNLQLINILKQRTQDDDVKRYAVQYMEGTGSFEYCRKSVRELKTKAHQLITELDNGSGTGDAVKVILDKMAIE